MKTPLFETIENTIDSLNTNTISEERKAILNPLTDYIKSKIDAKAPININFICTHNSRRSHLSQIWAQTMATFFNIENVTCYSGGTEATAMFPKVGETLQNQGFQVLKLSDNDNPVYAIKYAKNNPAVIAFSKTYGDEFNPESEFAAIMTCSSADGGCPFVAGCDKRIAITYEDPKASDGTPEQSKVYAERSLQIATEMKYVFENL
ncbi:arsenate-mycothiol transferase ArsC [Neotamlana laminarinivorans]|uniref:Protein-tyrosine-phosphatase n=1 Tax=Neotamlana laminarinivorans TaxID=2883124 RepID=A0A9X1L485_9FLAO|nr:protein-tyrosine-phosphatase [Tamlana laminarinivorans]MCB4798056.1 protein-tyrosine-phosphatase [Tamlana laminarinivorans]